MPTHMIFVLNNCFYYWDWDFFGTKLPGTDDSAVWRDYSERKPGNVRKKVKAGYGV